MSQPLRVAGFELIISGRFWVTAKEGQPLVELAETLAYSNPFVPEGDIGRNGLDFRVHQWIKIL